MGKEVCVTGGGLCVHSTSPAGAWPPWSAAGDAGERPDVSRRFFVLQRHGPWIRTETGRCRDPDEIVAPCGLGLDYCLVQPLGWVLVSTTTLTGDFVRLVPWMISGGATQLRGGVADPVVEEA